MPNDSIPNRRSLPPSNALAPMRPGPPPAPYVDVQQGYGYGYGSEPAEDNAAGGLLEYWRILMRYKGTLVMVACLGLLAAMLYSLPQTPVYKARTTIEIQTLNADFMNMRQVSAVSDPSSGDYWNGPDIQTQIRLLKSTSLALRVGAKVAARMPPQPPKPTSRIAAWRKALNLSGSEAQTPGLIQDIADFPCTARAAGTTRVVEISCESTNPRMAAEYANTMVGEFIDQNLESRWQTTQRTGEWLSRQLDDMRIKLERSEDGLQSYARQSGLLYTAEKNSVSEEKLRQLQESLSKAQADRVARQSRYEVARSGSINALSEVSGEVGPKETQAKLIDLRRQMAELSSVYTPAHYKVKRIEAQVASLEASLQKERGSILARIGNDFDEAQRRERMLAADYANQARLVSTEAGKAIRYNILKREVDTNRQLYEAMLQRVKESSIAAAMRASNVRVVDAAIPPRFPFKPRVVLNAMLGLLGGLFAGAAFIIARDRVDRTIKEAGDANFYLNVPELGVIPNANVGSGKRSYYFRKPKAGELAAVGEDAASRQLVPVEGSEASLPTRIELVTFQKHMSIMADSFRTTLTSILFSSQAEQRPRVLVVTSANPGEGKTTVITNLAIALAEVSQRVLLIDGDMRKPRIHDIFELPNDAGFADLLRNNQAARDGTAASYIRQTPVPGLSVLTSGRCQVAATNLLYSRHLPELMERFASEFDMILIDAPPMLQIPDGRVLGRMADAVIMVVRANKTTRGAAQAVRQRLAEDGTPLLGTILNDWDPKSAHGGYYAKYEKYYTAG
jgi:capsular exopolysaccharide synthesis family protein